MNKMSDPYTNKIWRLAFRWKYHDFKKKLEPALSAHAKQKVNYIVGLKALQLAFFMGYG